MEVRGIVVKGSSKNLMSFRCDADLVGRLYKNHAVILTYVKGFLGNMTTEDVVQMSGKSFFRDALKYISFAATLCAIGENYASYYRFCERQKT